MPLRPARGDGGLRAVEDLRREPPLNTTTTAGPPAGPRAERIRWIPKQYGAWAILAVPLLLGVAATGPNPWHLVLGAAAGCAYLASVGALEWARSRRRRQLRPVAAFGAAALATGVPLLIVQPALLWIAAYLVALGALALAISLAGRPKSLIVSLVEVAEALALVPAAALLARVTLEPAVGLATLAAGLYLVGSVLMVRSVIRERGNRAFLAASVTYHALAVPVAWLLLPAPYAVFATGLLGRAVALPLNQARPGARLRPIHVGIVEILASVVLVAAGFLVGF